MLKEYACSHSTCNKGTSQRDSDMTIWCHNMDDNTIILFVSILIKRVICLEATLFTYVNNKKQENDQMFPHREQSLTSIKFYKYPEGLKFPNYCLCLYTFNIYNSIYLKLTGRRSTWKGCWRYCLVFRWLFWLCFMFLYPRLCISI